MHPFLLTLIHLAIAFAGLLIGSFVTAIVASQSNLQGAYNALYAYAAIALIGLIGLGYSLFQRASHVATGQRVAWLVLYAAGAACLVLVFGFVTLVMTNR